MNLWELVAGLGGVVSLAGLSAAFRRYRRGEITLRYLLACVVGLASFISYALVSALSPDLATGIVTILLLVPALAAIVVLVRGHRKLREAGHSGR
jgi:uncharacterized membrane protein YfcA